MQRLRHLLAPLFHALHHLRAACPLDAARFGLMVSIGPEIDSDLHAARL